jgi:ubiquinone/menaquinone biosynthesis C-methylase UbiE
MQKLDQYDERFVESGFDAVAADYAEVLFLRRAAEALVEVVCQRAVGRALDVATGPGTSAVLLAGKVQGCRVVGIDVAPGMVEQASQRAQRLGLPEVRFEVASALSLPFGACAFDAVLCSSAIYYMPDFESALREWLRVLRPGGMLAFSTFGAGVLEPMSTLFDARVRACGIVVPQPTPLFRLNQAATCRDLLASVGLVDVATHERQLGYWVRDEDAWWHTLMSTGFQALVAALSPSERRDFERAHKAEVRAHVARQGLWVDAPVIVACGIKPAAAVV